MEDILTEEHKKKITYLKQYRYLNKDIDRKIKLMEDWKSKLLNITPILSDMPKGGNRSDKISDGIVNLDEIERGLKEDIDELIRLRDEIEGKIDAINDLKLREILKCRYLDCKGFEEIAFTNNYSWRHTHRLHELALDKINMS